MPRPLGDSCPCEGPSCGLKLTVQFQWTSQKSNPLIEAGKAESEAV